MNKFPFSVCKNVRKRAKKKADFWGVFPGQKHPVFHIFFGKKNAEITPNFYGKKCTTPP